MRLRHIPFSQSGVRGPRRRTLRVLAISPFTAALLAVGCDDRDDVKSYRTAKEVRPPIKAPSDSTAHGSTGVMVWDLPQGWAGCRIRPVTAQRTGVVPILRRSTAFGRNQTVAPVSNRCERSTEGSNDPSHEAAARILSPVPPSHRLETGATGFFARREDSQP